MYTYIYKNWYYMKMTISFISCIILRVCIRTCINKCLS